MSDKVGKKTGKKTQAGKDVYVTPEGKNVSEISRTFKYKGKWINVPSIHKGREYDQKTLKLMLEAEVIKPTSTHDSRTEAEAAARDRSDRLKFDEGGMATEEERLGFVESYGVEPVTDINTDLTFKDAATSVAEMTPIIGDAMAAKEVYDELMKDEPNYGLIAALGGAALVGAVPGIGDAAAAGIRKASDMIKRIEVDPDAVGMMGGNIRIKPKAEEGTPTVEAAGLTDEAIEEWREKNATSEEFRKKLKGRNEELQELASGVEEGRVFTSTYRKRADELRPIRVVEEVPKPATFVEAVSALNAGKRKKPMIGLNASIPDGDQVTARLDIDAYTDYDVWVPTLTHPELKTVYKPSVVLKDVKFIQPEGREPKKALGVAKGGGKAPFAVMSGKYVGIKDDDAFDLAKEVFDYPEFTQVGYDPTRRGFFYDRETGEAIVAADMVVQVGHLVLARNAKKMDAEAFPFNEGGMALEEQMMMNFGDVPDNTVGIDPVSGNEIPLGSTAENVRDDIPAQLSEGEMVIPADVVRFFGVKFFEDIRQAAKIGYAKMAEDGRIGGEPMDIEDESGLGLEMADLEVMDDGAPVEMYRGGTSMKDYKDVGKNRAIKAPKRTAPRKTHAEIMASVFRDDDNNSSSSSSNSTSSSSKSTSSGSKSTSSGSKSSDFYSPENISKRVQERKNKPKTKGEAFYRALTGYLFDNEDDTPDNRRVKLYEKPPMSDDERRFGTIDEQINFGNNFADDEKTKKEPPKVERPKVDKRTSTVQDLRAGEDPFFTKLYKNSGLEKLYDKLTFDEGGDVVQEGTTGGFGEEIPLADTGVMEAREYQNNAGHVIIIMFLDGVPLQEIPEGYYPVGSEPIAVDPGEETGTSSQGGGRSDDDDDDDDDKASEPFNYKTLTIDELTTEVKNLKAPPPFGFGILGSVLSMAQKRHNKKTIEEIDRRLKATDLPIYEREYLQNLKEVAEGPKDKGIVGKIIDDLTGEETEKPDLPTLDGPKYDMLPDKYGVIEGYTPDIATPDASTSYPSSLGPEILKEIEEASAEAAANAFSGYKAPGTEDDDDDDGPTIKPTKPASTQVALDNQSAADAAMGRPTDSSDDDDDDSPTFRPPAPAPKPSPIYDNEAAGDYDDDSTGVHKGALMDKPKVKKVVKGLKKASKTHAKQADQLEGMMKKKPKKKSK